MLLFLSIYLLANNFNPTLEFYSTTVSSAYNEEPCVGLGGLCQRTSTRCAGGAYLSGKCPTQPGNVRCCKPGLPVCTLVV